MKEGQWAYAVVMIVLVLVVGLLVESYMTSQENLAYVKAGLVQKVVVFKDDFGVRSMMIWTRPNEPTGAEPEQR